MCFEENRIAKITSLFRSIIVLTFFFDNLNSYCYYMYSYINSVIFSSKYFDSNITLILVIQFAYYLC